MNELGELKVYEIYKARFSDVYVLVPADWGGNDYCEAIFVPSIEISDWWTRPLGKEGEFWSEAEYIGVADSLKDFLAMLI